MKRGRRHETPWETGQQCMMSATARRSGGTVVVVWGRDAMNVRVGSALVLRLTVSPAHAALPALTTHAEVAPQPQHAPFNAARVVWVVARV